MSGAAMDESKAPLVPNRSCGECQACCIVVSIDAPELQKVSASPCRHSLCGGCDIYEARPNVCQEFFCGWRRSMSFPDNWRPDISGIFSSLEPNTLPQYGPLAVRLMLTGNPLKTVRRPDFLDFVAKHIQRNIALILVLPGPRGSLAARLTINDDPQIKQAASRAEVRTILETLLKKLVDYPVSPYTMKHAGHDVST